MKITKKQTQLLHIGKTFLGLPDSQYRLMLSEYWVKSSRDLTYQEASELLNKMVEMGFKIITKRYGHKKKLPPNIIELVSEQQLRKIEHLKNDIRWYAPQGFEKWCLKYLKKEKIQTSIDAFKVIEALKAMKDRQQKAKQMEQRTAGEEGLRRDGSLHGGRWQW